MPLQRARGHEIEALRRLAVDRELGPHPALFGEEIGQADLADSGRDLVGEEAVEPALRPRAGHFELGEGAHLEEADLLVHVTALGAHDREVVGAAEAPLLADRLARGALRVVLVQQDVRLGEIGLAERIALRREPGRTLPAVDGAEHGAQRRHSVMAGEAAQRTGGGALLVRIVDGEDLGVGLLVLFLQIAAARIGAEAAGIDAHHVQRRLAVDDPVCELPACAASGGDAEAMALVQPEVL